MSQSEGFEDVDHREEDVPLSVPSKFRKLEAEEGNMTVRQLWDRSMKGTLDLQAEFQREYVWDDKRASIFIESLLLNLPVSPIFLAENEDGTHEVVDGHQRLESLFGFLQPLATGPARTATVKPRHRALVLRDLDVLHQELDGRNVSALSLADRRTLLERELRVISIPKSAHPDIRFVLFERLNLGSVPLNAQELRNCIYRGPYNELIKELARDSDTLAFFGRKLPHKRMRDRELVLRFFALSHMFGEYRTPFRSFLNEEMKSNRNCSPSDRWGFKDEFEKAKVWTEMVFGQHACCLFRAGNQSNPRGRWDRRTDLVYDVEMVGFSKFARELEDIINGGKIPADAFLTGLRHQLVGVMVLPDFLRTLSEGTTRPANMQLRHDLWDNRLAFAVQQPDAIVEQTEQLRRVLKRTNLCQECMTPIDSLEDAMPIHQGDSAAVAHRFCYGDRASRLSGTVRRVKV